MDRKSSSAPPSVKVGRAQLNAYDLDMIRTNAVDLLRDYQMTVSEAWVTSTINYLNKIGLLELNKDSK